MSETPGDPAIDPGIDRPTAAAAMSLLLVSIGLVVLDVRVQRVDVLSDPVGFAFGVEGVRRLRRATPPTWWSLGLLTLAPVAVVAAVVAEVGRVVHGEATGVGASALVPATAPGWVADAAAVASVLSVVGVLSLARHLRRVLSGIASDRWRQVTFAWVAFVGAGVASLATGAIELIVFAAAAGITAATLLVLSLLATRRLLEEGPMSGPSLSGGR